MTSRGLRRRDILGGLALAPAMAMHPTILGAAEPVRSLSTAAAKGGRYFGAAVRIDQLKQEPALRSVLLQDCGWVTPEIHMKWDSLQPRADAYNFGPADGLTAFAAQHDLKVRGHTLLWDQSTPAWAKAALADKDGWRNVQQFFASVVPRYADQVSVWDVVNEPIDVHGKDGLRTNIFLKAFGPDYIARALHDAKALAPRAQLAINDYGFDYDNSEEEGRRKRFLKLLETLKRHGAPVDSVGLQAHLDLSKGGVKTATLRPFLRDLAGLGLDIAITELDVKEQDLSAPLAVRDQRVADEARAYLDIALAEPAVKGVITWGLSDRHSWLQGDAAGSGKVIHRALPYDDTLTPKPMYWAVRQSFENQGASASNGKPRLG